MQDGGADLHNEEDRYCVVIVALGAVLAGSTLLSPPAATVAPAPMTMELLFARTAFCDPDMMDPLASALIALNFS